MAARKNLIYGLLIFLLAIFRIKSDLVETKEEVQGNPEYVPKPDNDSLSRDMI